jgi:hypothetical protein
VAITTIPVNRKAAAIWAANSRVCLIMPHCIVQVIWKYKSQV